VGTGDSFGMAVAHAVASGMGGLRTTGDLVVRLQMTRGMKLKQAKDHLAQRLGVSPADLSDNVAMHELRGELRLGRIYEVEASHFADPSPIEAKTRIARLLGIPINSVERFIESSARVLK
jgi:dimethylamine---corrinoid protein Co-methyltransferase